MMKILFYFLFVVLHFSLLIFNLASPAYAAGEFETSFHSTYQIDDTGGGGVIHRIELTNLSPNTYASEYSVADSSTNVRQPQAFDQNGQLKLDISPQVNSTSLTVFLDQNPAIGQGKKREFAIKYDSPDIAAASGRILEVNIPKVANSNEFSDYSITIKVPKKFGKPSRIIPQPASLQETAIETIVLFNKQQLKTGVTAVFGTRQSFLLNLTYFLENKNSFESEMAIALVPDTPNQKVEYKSLAPRPKTIEIDADGNWLANYVVAAGEELAVTTELVAEVNLDRTVPVPAGNPNDYLGETEYWQTQDPGIKSLAQNLKTPEQIYNFVVETLSYDYSRAETGAARLGAASALANPGRAICTEFSDLFIALSRAAGIPAREKNGFAFTNNSKLRPLSLKKDVLHAWPEYWDARSLRWVEIDPTWADTTGGIDYFSKMDLAHITFVTHGISPGQPLPAGFYKTKNTQNKTVQVAPVEQTINYQPKIEISAFIPQVLSSWKKNQIKYRLVNRSGLAGYGLPLSIKTAYTIINPADAQIPAILPWQTLNRALEIKPPGGWEESSADLEITVGPAAKTYEINFAPPITKPAALAAAVAIVGVLAAAAAVFGRRLHFSRRQKQYTLHRQI